ncbi:hypothetical protein Hanom_Chr03g00250971 [Helianthus anomalus]
MCHDMGACKMMWHHLRQPRFWFWLQNHGSKICVYGLTRDPYHVIMTRLQLFSLPLETLIFISIILAVHSRKESRLHNHQEPHQQST